MTTNIFQGSDFHFIKLFTCAPTQKITILKLLSNFLTRICVYFSPKLVWVRSNFTFSDILIQLMILFQHFWLHFETTLKSSKSLQSHHGKVTEIVKRIWNVSLRGGCAGLSEEMGHRIWTQGDCGERENNYKLKQQQVLSIHIFIVSLEPLITNIA